MTEELWGVAVGGAIGFATATLSAVVAPLIGIRNERRKERAARLDEARDASQERFDAWSDAMRSILSTPSPSFQADLPALGPDLVSTLRKFTRDRDGLLRKQATAAVPLVHMAGVRCSAVIMAREAFDVPPSEPVRKAAQALAEAELAVHVVWSRAQDLADPLVWPFRYWRTARWLAHRRASASPIAEGILAVRSAQFALDGQRKRAAKLPKGR